MNYIAIGIIGFLTAYLFDVVSLKGISRLKLPVGIIAVSLIIYATVMACFRTEQFVLPAWITWLGWVLLPTFIFFFIYSLFINLPFRKTYITSGVGDKLIRTGTYALVRHPGVLWYAVILASLILVSRSELLLIASPIWFVMDLLHVTIQDKFLFSKMFKGYDDYRRETPMLIPNRKSIGAFLKSFRLPVTQSKV